MRPLPTEVRIVRDTGAPEGKEENLDAITMLHIPAKVYPNGSINFEYDFMQPGKFVGLVTVGGKEEYVSRFPFSVGEPKGTSPYLIGAIAVIASVPAYSSCAGANPRLPARLSRQARGDVEHGFPSPEQRPNQTEAIQSKQYGPNKKQKRLKDQPAHPLPWRGSFTKRSQECNRS